MWGKSVEELFIAGGFVMWPLLAMSVVVVAVTIERGIVFFRLRSNFPKLVQQLGTQVRQGRLGEARRGLQGRNDPISRAAAAYLDRLDVSGELRHEIVGREASQALSNVETRLNWLATIGHLAPMLGLLGTVTGLIGAFHQIEVRAGQVQPSDLAGGIWEALITTVFGLVVALPTLAAHHYFDQRVGGLQMRVQWIVAYLDEWLRQERGKLHDGDANSFAEAAPAEQPGFGVAS